MTRGIGMVLKSRRGGDEEWKTRGRCAETDPEVFFPESGNRSLADAQRICKKCEVRERCLEWALDTDERYGVWGGVDERERYRMRKKLSAKS